jgi:hypothetical protein
VGELVGAPYDEVLEDILRVEDCRFVPESLHWASDGRFGFYIGLPLPPWLSNAEDDLDAGEHQIREYRFEYG